MKQRGIAGVNPERVMPADRGAIYENGAGLDTILRSVL
jgi:hypothetical protein